MKSHSSLLLNRIIRAGLRVSLRYRVVAVGIDHRLRIINIKTNQPRLIRRGLHAEERVLHTSPRSLRQIVIARVGADGRLLPIDACDVCKRLARKRGIKIRPLWDGCKGDLRIKFD